MTLGLALSAISSVYGTELTALVVFGVGARRAAPHLACAALVILSLVALSGLALLIFEMRKTRAPSGVIGLHGASVIGGFCLILFGAAIHG